MSSDASRLTVNSHNKHITISVGIELVLRRQCLLTYILMAETAQIWPPDCIQSLFGFCCQSVIDLLVAVWQHCQTE